MLSHSALVNLRCVKSIVLQEEEKEEEEKEEVKKKNKKETMNEVVLESIATFFLLCFNF